MPRKQPKKPALDSDEDLTDLINAFPPPPGRAFKIRTQQTSSAHQLQSQAGKKTKQSGDEKFTNYGTHHSEPRRPEASSSDRHHANPDVDRPAIRVLTPQNSIRGPKNNHSLARNQLLQRLSSLPASQRSTDDDEVTEFEYLTGIEDSDGREAGRPNPTMAPRRPVRGSENNFQPAKDPYRPPIPEEEKESESSDDQEASNLDAKSLLIPPMDKLRENPKKKERRKVIYTPPDSSASETHTNSQGRLPAVSQSTKANDRLKRRDSKYPEGIIGHSRWGTGLRDVKLPGAEELSGVITAMELESKLAHLLEIAKWYQDFDDITNTKYENFFSIIDAAVKSATKRAEKLETWRTKQAIPDADLVSQPRNLENLAKAVNTLWKDFGRFTKNSDAEIADADDKGDSKLAWRKRRAETTLMLQRMIACLSKEAFERGKWQIREMKGMLFRSWKEEQQVSRQEAEAEGLGITYPGDGIRFKGNAGVR